MSGIVKTDIFEVGRVSYTEPKANSHGGKSIYLNYNGKPMTFQTPKMPLPFGMGRWESKDGSGVVKYSLDLSFREMAENEEVREFKRKMEELDEKLIKDGVKNSLSWFKKKSANEEVMRELYTPQVKVSKNKDTGEPNTKYAPTFKIKMPYQDAEKTFTCEVYNNAKQRVSVEEGIVKGATVQVLMKCTGVWFAGGKYGISWKAHQIKVTPPQGLQGYSFVEDESEIHESRPDATPVSQVHATAVEESETEETAADEEEEEEEEVEVQKPVKRLAGKR